MPSFPRRLGLPLLILILLAAFGVRVLGLAVLDLSDDEAFFVHIAHQGTYVSLAGSAEPHPPLYLAALQGWMFPAGVTEYAVRFLSVALGLATVAAAYVLGRQLGGQALGLATAAAAALNPYQVFYSQTARDYQMACLFGLASMIALLLALRRPRLIPAWTAAALLAIYSHYYALTVVLFEQAVLAGWLWRRRFKGWHAWAAADAALAALFVPWTVYAWRTIAAYEPGHGTPEIIGSALLQTFQFYNFGTAFRPADIVGPSVLAILLLIAGAVGLARFHRGRALALSVGYQAAPIVLGLITLVHTTQFGARFLFLGSPGYLLLGGGAITLLARRGLLALLPLALLAAQTGFAVHNTVFSDQFTDKAYSRLAAYLAARIGPADSVVLDGVSQSLQYWYYAQLRQGIGQPVAILPLNAEGGGADGSAVDVGQTQRALNGIASRSPGIWLIDDDSLRYDPHLDTQRILARDTYRAFSQAFRGQRLDFYVTGPAPEPAPRSIELEGVTLGSVSPAPPAAPAGQPIRLRLVWQARRDNPPPFKVSLRLSDAAGAVVVQDDEPAGEGFWDEPWPAGAGREDRRALVVPVGTPPGSYGLQLVAYDAATGHALGPPVSLGSVRVDHSAPQRAPAAGLPPFDAVLAGERLVGAAVPAQIPAGEKLTLTLLWSGGPAPDAESLPVTLGPVQVEHQLGGGAYPTDRWLPGDVVRDIVTVRVPASLAPGRYPLTIGSVKLATIRVLPTRRQFSAPSVPKRSSARFGDIAQLLGYEVSPAGTSTHVRLVWKALAETPVSYTVFVHALNSEGAILAQADAAPGTDNWDAGEVVTTEYTLATGGPARVEIGLYDARSGARLPVCQAAPACGQPADHLDLPAG